jgi:hypothetical protein
MANYYGVYSGDGFACAPLEAQAWWGKQGGVCGGALRVLNISHEVWKLTTHFVQVRPRQTSAFVADQAALHQTPVLLLSVMQEKASAARYALMAPRPPVQLAPVTLYYPK